MQLPKTTPSGLGDHIACTRVAIQNLARSWSVWTFWKCHPFCDMFGSPFSIPHKDGLDSPREKWRNIIPTYLLLELI